MEKMKDTLKVGILGTGRMAAVMAEAITHMPQVTAVAAASRSPEKARAFADAHGIGKAYGSYVEMLSDPEVELVYIASPHSHHREHAKLCLENGKPVLCEKSFTVNTEEAEELINLSEEKHLLLAEAIWTRYMPLAKQLKEIAHDGSIGQIRSLSCSLCYNTIGNPRVALPEYAGGALLDVGIYCLTFLSLVLGDEVGSVTASMVRTPEGVDAEDHVLLTYNDGGNFVNASFYSSITGPSDRSGMICGTGGYIAVGNINNFEYIEVYDSSHKLLRRIDRPKQPGTGYEYQFDSCRKVLREGKTECPEMPHSEIIAMMRLMDRIRRVMGLKYPSLE